MKRSSDLKNRNRSTPRFVACGQKLSMKGCDTSSLSLEGLFCSKLIVLPVLHGCCCGTGAAAAATAVDDVALLLMLLLVMPYWLLSWNTFVMEYHLLPVYARHSHDAAALGKQSASSGTQRLELGRSCCTRTQDLHLQT